METKERKKELDEQIIQEWSNQILKQWQKSWEKDEKVRRCFDEALSSKSNHVDYLVLVSCFEDNFLKLMKDYYPSFLLGGERYKIFKILSRNPEAIPQALRKGTKQFFPDARELLVGRKVTHSDFGVIGVMCYEINIYFPEKDKKDKKTKSFFDDEEPKSFFDA